jgi:hypothetical protein
MSSIPNRFNNRVKADDGFTQNAQTAQAAVQGIQGLPPVQNAQASQPRNAGAGRAQGQPQAQPAQPDAMRERAGSYARGFVEDKLENYYGDYDDDYAQADEPYYVRDSGGEDYDVRGMFSKLGGAADFWFGTDGVKVPLAFRIVIGPFGGVLAVISAIITGLFVEFPGLPWLSWVFAALFTIATFLLYYIKGADPIFYCLMWVLFILSIAFNVIAIHAAARQPFLLNEPKSLLLTMLGAAMDICPEPFIVCALTGRFKVAVPKAVANMGRRLQRGKARAGRY